MSADLVYELEISINRTIDSSELVRMAQKHFDEESVKMMIEELKESIKEDIESAVYDIEDEDEDEEED